MKAVLSLGDPRLRVACAEVEDLDDPAFVEERRALAATLVEFRAKFGFGRAIAAPQIGLARRFIAMVPPHQGDAREPPAAGRPGLSLGQAPMTLINPRITWRSDEKFTMWDDCMCFPTMFVRVERHASISVKFFDEEGVARMWKDLDRAVSELVQHELDHLDGLLATDRMTSRTTGVEPLVSREAFAADPETFRKMVDYVIA